MSDFFGELLAIQISDNAAEEMQQLDQIEATEGAGLVGDRYANLKGAFQKGTIQPSQQVTLIEQESIQAANADYKVQITHAITRRNLLTSCVPLNHLVGKQFCIGHVILKGIKLCEPCGYLNQHSGQDLLSALRHRGGLRAEIVAGGKLRVGDLIRVTSSKGYAKSS